MHLSWILLALVAWALGVLFVLVLARMAGEQDRVARQDRKRFDPCSDVTITHFGKGWRVPADAQDRTRRTHPRTGVPIQ